MIATIATYIHAAGMCHVHPHRRGMTDTTNFRAQQGALALTITNRSKNISKFYDCVYKEWKTWCDRLEYDDDNLVHESKLVRFLIEEMIARSLKSLKKRKRDEMKIAKNLFLLANIDDENANASSQTLKY